MRTSTADVTELFLIFQKIIHDCFGKADDCFTRMLEEWLITKPKWTGLIDALKARTVEREDVARDIEAKLNSS